MKNLTYGFLGFFVALVIYLMAVSQYSDYRANAEIGHLFFAAQPTIEKIEESILKDEGFDQINFEPTSKYGRVDHKILKNGSVVMFGAFNGQALIFIPEIKGDKVVWHCFAGSKKITPSGCNG